MMSDIKGGAHLGEMRRWIQWHALNGDTVTWGSRDLLRLKDVTAGDLDRLAQDIRDAVLREFKVRDSDHQYRYSIFCEDGCAAFQFADTIEEIWAKLYRARGPVMVKDGTLTSVDEPTQWIFHGTPEEARAWCLAQRDTK
jgi:hypothetical protein